MMTAKGAKAKGGKEYGRKNRKAETRQARAARDAEAVEESLDGDLNDSCSPHEGYICSQPQCPYCGHYFIPDPQGKC